MFPDGGFLSVTRNLLHPGWRLFKRYTSYLPTLAILAVDTAEKESFSFSFLKFMALFSVTHDYIPHLCEIKLIMLKKSNFGSSS